MVQIKRVKLKAPKNSVFFYCMSILLILATNFSEADVISGKINVTLKEKISKFFPKTIQYFLTSEDVPDPLTTKLTVDISTDSIATFHDPLLITIQQRDDTKALELPFSFDDEPNNNSVIYRTISAPLCFRAKRIRDGHLYKNISVTLKTSNENQIDASVTLRAHRNLYLPLEEEYTVEVSPTKPTYLRFEFNDPTLNTVLLKAISKDPQCMTLSIQTPSCPIYDTEANVKYQGRWQTMSRQAATTIKKEGYFSTGFFVVLVVDKNDVPCDVHSLPHPKDQRRKTVTLFLERVRPLDSWLYFSLAILLPALFALAIGFVTFLTLFFFRRFIEREMLAVATNLGCVKPLTRKSNSTKSENDMTNSSANRSSLDIGKFHSYSDPGLLDTKMMTVPKVAFGRRASDEEVILAEYSAEESNNESHEDIDTSTHNSSGNSKSPLCGSLTKENKFRFISLSIQNKLDSIFSETENDQSGQPNEVSATSEKSTQEISKDSFEMEVTPKAKSISNHNVADYPSDIQLLNKMCHSKSSFTPTRNVKTIKEYFSALKSLKNESKFSREVDIAALIKLQKSEKENVRRLKRYLWTAVTVAIFYSVPVYQLIIQYLMLYKSGNYDLCYYNFLCAIPFWIFVDFNHICSNCNYIIFGVVFICIVRTKRDMHKEIIEKVSSEILHNYCIFPNPVSVGNKDDNQYETIKKEVNTFLESHGVPLHYEFYYTLAFVLIMEGFMSGAYHICPNQSTFQFDTCFMYIIAVMGILKIYQMRHPIYLGPSQVFLLVSLFQLFIFLCLTVEQYHISALVHFLKGIFTIAHILWNVFFWIHCYAVGHIKYDGTGNCDWKLIFKQLWPIFLNAHPTRIIPPLLMLVIHSLIIKEHYSDDFANYLLFLLLATFLGHTVCYIIMKLINRELKWWALFQSILYFTLLGVVGPFSLKYFHAKLTQWDKTSAQSREGNQECSFYEFYPFYDQHDIWHFLSAGAIFFYYMRSGLVSWLDLGSCFLFLACLLLTVCNYRQDYD